MKATKIYYKRLFSLGNYQNEEIGMEIQVEDGEKASDVLQKAKQFISGLDPNNKAERNYLEAAHILKYKENYSYKEVIESEEIVKIYEENQASKDELPF